MLVLSRIHRALPDVDDVAPLGLVGRIGVELP